MTDGLNDAEWLDQVLRETTVVRPPHIGPDTEIYYDLRISGDDLDELVASAARRCGARDLALAPGRYAPGEPGDWFDWLFKSRTRRRYQSLTVAKLLGAKAETRALHRSK